MKWKRCLHRSAKFAKNDSVLCSTVAQIEASNLIKNPTVGTASIIKSITAKRNETRMAAHLGPKGNNRLRNNDEEGGGVVETGRVRLRPNP